MPDRRDFPEHLLQVHREAKTGVPGPGTGTGQAAVGPAVRLWLRVENNSKFVRGKGKAREAIEREVLSRFAMEKPDPKGSEYLLSIPYFHEDELDRIIYEEIFAEMESQVDERHCFIEADMAAVDDPERRW